MFRLCCVLFDSGVCFDFLGSGICCFFFVVVVYFAYGFVVVCVAFTLFSFVTRMERGWLVVRTIFF